MLFFKSSWGRFWTSGKFEDHDILVWSDKIPTPVNVRYAWASNPIISIENRAGLPLFPFRTDTESKN
jgi:sialate O-acetylesterase